MNHLSIKGVGLAVGTAVALFYLGCMLVMLILGRHGTIMFFNSLLHGLDVTQVIHMDVPIWEAILGIIQTFILGWFFGAIVALIYNLWMGNKYP